MLSRSVNQPYTVKFIHFTSFLSISQKTKAAWCNLERGQLKQAHSNVRISVRSHTVPCVPVLTDNSFQRSTKHTKTQKNSASTTYSECTTPNRMALQHCAVRWPQKHCIFDMHLGCHWQLIATCVSIARTARPFMVQEICTECAFPRVHFDMNGPIKSWTLVLKTKLP